MKKMLYGLFLGLTLITVFLLPTRQTGAELGGSVDTVESDRTALSTTQDTTKARNGYSIHEFEAGATAVREYISPSGVVFGIAWNGLIHPDLDWLLGPYAGEYRRALQQTPRKLGRRCIQLKTDSLAVEKWGHMRNLQGRAYDPALVPEGVSTDEIR